MKIKIGTKAFKALEKIKNINKLTYSFKILVTQVI